MGISKIRHYKPYKGVPISRDYNVRGKQIYIGNGQNCGTFWFASVEEAKRFIDAYHDKIDPEKHGLGLIPKELCERCQCHYSAFTKEYKKYKPFVCQKFKEELIRNALSNDKDVT